MNFATMLANGPVIFSNSAARGRVLDIIRNKPLQHKEIARLSGLSLSWSQVILKDLERDGLIMKVKAVVPPNTMGAIPWVWAPVTLKVSDET